LISHFLVRDGSDSIDKFGLVSLSAPSIVLQGDRPKGRPERSVWLGRLRGHPRDPENSPSETALSLIAVTQSHPRTEFRAYRLGRIRMHCPYLRAPCTISQPLSTPTRVPYLDLSHAALSPSLAGYALAFDGADQKDVKRTGVESR
jgi:hypothetical protein